MIIQYYYRILLGMILFRNTLNCSHYFLICMMLIILNILAIAYYDSGDYKLAIENFNHAYEIFKENDTKGDALALCLNNLGNSYKMGGEANKSMGFFEQALKIYQDLYKNQNHPAIALTLNNIGSACDLADDGREKQAIEYFKKALDMFNAVYKEANHETKALVLNNMGLAYRDLHDYKNAQESFEKSMEMYKALYGPSNKDVAKVLNNIGLVFDESGQDKKAIEYINNALAMYKEIYGKNTPNPAVAQCYYNSG